MAKSNGIRADAVALSSFPRSGNTFLRLVLYDCFGYPSWSVYGKEHFLEHVSPSSVMVMQKENSVFVKTHLLREEHLSEVIPTNFMRVIHLVRDPREAINSLSHYAETAGQFIKDKPRAMTCQEWKDKYLEKQSLRWCNMINSWKTTPHRVVIKFEDLILDPVEIVGDTLENLGFEITRTEKDPPTFTTLNKSSSMFFRKGETDSWKRELLAPEIAKIEKICGDEMDFFEYV